MKKIRAPGWTEHLTFDEAAECLPCSLKTTSEIYAMARRTNAETESEKFYNSVVPSGKREFPLDPGEAYEKGFALKNVWSKLSPEAQRDLVDAYDKEYPGRS